MPGFVLDTFTHFEVVMFKTLTSSSSLKLNVQEGTFDEERNHHLSLYFWE